MADTFELTLNSPLTDEQWDMIEDVDFDRTDSITFHTKHGKEVEFKKVRHGRWIHDGYDSPHGIDWMHCSECGSRDMCCLAAMTSYCPTCGAKMDAERKEG